MWLQVHPPPPRVRLEAERRGGSTPPAGRGRVRGLELPPTRLETLARTWPLWASVSSSVIGDCTEGPLSCCQLCETRGQGEIAEGDDVKGPTARDSWASGSGRGSRWKRRGSRLGGEEPQGAVLEGGRTCPGREQRQGHLP